MVEVTFPQYDFKGDYSKVNLERFFKHCADHEVSDILIQGGDQIWVELHGRQRPATATTINQGQLPSIISQMWGAEVETNIRAGNGADRALEISGEHLGIARGKSLRFRCNFIQGRVGRLDEAYIITSRVIVSELQDILTMGIEPDLFEALYPGSGLVITCGPTGSGKTTLQSAAYGYAGITMPDRKVITYEDPIENVLGGPHWKGPQPSQSQIGRDIKNFALALKNAMRRKPSIIGIGEVRDLETLESLIEAALTGHTCNSTAHTESVAETINRLIQMYPAAQQASAANRLMGALRVILVQRLVKTTDGRRQAIREYVVFDREYRNELQEHPPERWAPMIRKRLESQGATLDDKAWQLYVDGRITEHEFIELAGRKAFTLRKQAAA